MKNPFNLTSSHSYQWKRRLAGAAMLAVMSFSITHARTWTSSDGGKTFEGDLTSYDPASGMVGVKLANGSVMNFNREKLAAADLAFLKEQGATSPAPASSGGVSAADVPEALPDPDDKEANMSKPVQVYILMGQSNMVGAGKIPTLEAAVKEGLYPYLIDDAGKWTERKDVRNVRVMVGKGGGMQLFNNEWMRVTGKTIGPEFGIGHVLGHVIDEPVLILKSCIGNRSLGWDLLPPGSEPYEFNGKTEPGYRGTPENPKGNGEKVEGAWYAGKQYDDDVENAKAVLADLNKYYPGAKKYEVAGFFFWQGEKDCGNAAHAENYEANLVRFIKRLRTDFEAPDAKFVLATLGEAKKGTGGNGGKVLDAQLAVDGATGKHKEFKGNVATVYANPLSNGGSGNSHYNGNAGTYMNVGEAMGRAMAALLSN